MLLALGWSNQQDCTQPNSAEKSIKTSAKTKMEPANGVMIPAIRVSNVIAMLIAAPKMVATIVKHLARAS